MNPAWTPFTPQSVIELEAARRYYRAAPGPMIKGMQPRVSSPLDAPGSPSLYLLDQGFAHHALASVNTLADALAICDALDKGASRRAHRAVCAKAREARAWLTKADSFWTQTPERLRLGLAHNRRICCACHETGSFASHRRADAAKRAASAVYIANGWDSAGRARPVTAH
jgi:hypothetical protein